MKGYAVVLLTQQTELHRVATVLNLATVFAIFVHELCEYGAAKTAENQGMKKLVS